MPRDIKSTFSIRNDVCKKEKMMRDKNLAVRGGPRIDVDRKFIWFILAYFMFVYRHVETYLEYDKKYTYFY